MFFREERPTVLDYKCDSNKLVSDTGQGSNKTLIDAQLVEMIENLEA